MPLKIEENKNEKRQLQETDNPSKSRKSTARIQRKPSKFIQLEEPQELNSERRNTV